MRKVAAIACAGALAFTLAGCGGGGSSLDRTVIVGDLSLKVPSSWSEEDLKQSQKEMGFPTDDYYLDYFVYRSDDESSMVYVLHQEKDEYNSSSQKSLESNKNTLMEHSDAESFKYDLVSSDMENGILVDVYDTVTVLPDQTQNVKEVFIYDGDEVYNVRISGDDIDAEAVVDSIEMR